MTASDPLKILFFGSMLLLASGCDVVTNKYPTLQDAREDALFRRGWLPDILPESAVSIRTSNDLDINTSEGEFTIAIQDVGDFVKQLSDVDEPYAGHSGYIKIMQLRGYEGFTYTEGDTWLFLCKRKTGHCAYRLPYSGLGS